MADRDEFQGMFDRSGAFDRPTNPRLKRGEILDAFSSIGSGFVVVFGHDESCREIAERVLQERASGRTRSESSK